MAMEDPWGSLDILRGFGPLDPGSNPGGSVVYLHMYIHSIFIFLKN